MLNLVVRADLLDSADIEDGGALERGAPGASEVAFLVGAPVLGAGSLSDTQDDAFAGTCELIA